MHAASFPPRRKQAGQRSSTGPNGTGKKSPGRVPRRSLIPVCSKDPPLARPLCFQHPFPSGEGTRTRWRWVQPKLRSPPVSAGQRCCLLAPIAPTTSLLYTNSILLSLQWPALTKPSFESLLMRGLPALSNPMNTALNDSMVL